MKEKLRSLKIGSGISIGLLRGSTIAISLLALSNIVFIDGLAPYVLSGAGMFLIGTAILCFVTALLGKFPAPVVTSPMPVVLAMVVIAESVNLQGQALFHTFILTIIGCAIFTGLMFWLLGTIKIADYFRYIPFSLSAAALAGSGLILLLFALRLAGISWEFDSLPRLFEPAIFSKWFLSVLFGVVLLFLTNRWKNVWIIPLMFVSFSVCCHAIFWILDFSNEHVVRSSLFLDLDSTGTLFTPYFLEDLRDVEWTHLLAQSFNVVALFVVLLVLTVVSLSQLELGARLDLDWNREFKVHGLANFLSGVGGGIPGGVIASVSLPNIRLRANTPITSITIAVILVFFAGFGTKLVGLIPIPAISGFLLSIAYPLIHEWLIKSRKKLSRIEYGILVFICLTIVFWGFLEAIILGLIISLTLLIIRVSRTSVIQSRTTLKDTRSHTIRSIPEGELYNTYGEQVRMYRLQGYLLFGNTHSLVSEIRRCTAETPRSICFIIDLAEVQGVDLSASDSLRKLCQFMHRQHIPIIFSAAPSRFKKEIAQDYINLREAPVEWYDSEDHALERGEELLLDWYNEQSTVTSDLRLALFDQSYRRLEHFFDQHREIDLLIEELVVQCKVIDYSDQDYIVRRDQLQSGMQILIAGTVNAIDTVGNVVQQCGRGTIFEHKSAIEKQVATQSWIADGPCRTILVTPDNLRALEANQSEIATRLFRYVMQYLDVS